jgi:flavin reductase (DIM6/NTAB) family NADH-FMN oxidoreductase RutF
MQIRYCDAAIALAGIKHPARVAIAVCQGTNGRANAITLEWFMRTSIQPLMFAISIGHTRYSYECLLQNRRFNLCFPSESMRDWAMLCGTRSGREIDKFEGVPILPGRLAGLPVPRESAAVFECEIITQVRSGDHTIFIGEVRHTWANPELSPLLLEQLLR